MTGFDLGIGVDRPQPLEIPSDENVASPVGDLRLVQHVRRHSRRDGVDMWRERVHERLS